jgi:hypothetical protein
MIKFLLSIKKLDLRSLKVICSFIGPIIDDNLDIKSDLYLQTFLELGIDRICPMGVY